MAFWTPKDYTPFFLFDEPTHTVKEIRAEYTRQRDIAVKRAKRFEAVGLTAQAEYLLEMFPKLAEIDKAEQARREMGAKKMSGPSVGDYLARGKSILEQASGSLAGVRRIQKSIFDETGELVPLGEVLPFNEYMRSWRLSAFSRTMVPSGDAADLYNTDDYQEIGGSFSDFYSLFLEESR